MVDFRSTWRYGKIPGAQSPSQALEAGGGPFSLYPPSPGCVVWFVWRPVVPCPELTSYRFRRLIGVGIEGVNGQLPNEDVMHAPALGRSSRVGDALQPLLPLLPLAPESLRPLILAGSCLQGSKYRPVGKA